MRIELICIGTELLSGKVNTHGSCIGRTLNELGLFLSEEHTVPDSKPDIVSTVKTSLTKSRILFICGGLGPTFDDVTRESVSQALNKKLLFNEKLYKQINKKIHTDHHIPSAHENRQAYLIEGAIPIYNTVGTAPGQIIHNKNKTIILLPGPLRELIPMIKTTVVPFFKKHFSRQKIRSLTLHLIGLLEAEIDQHIRPIIEQFPSNQYDHIQYTILADASVVSLLITIQGKNTRLLDKQLNKIKKNIYAVLGNNIFGEGCTSLEGVVARLLTKTDKTLSVAESCTGGLLCGRITSIPGSSFFFKQGLIVYSNEGKIKLLDIPKALIEREGAVSGPVAHALAEHIRMKAQTHYGLSITGIAGPDGATRTKKAGLVYIGISTPTETCVEEFNLKGDRAAIREQTVMVALDMLRRKLIKENAQLTMKNVKFYQR